MKLKRYLTILLILALSVMMFTACGGDDDDSDKDSEKENTTTNNDTKLTEDQAKAADEEMIQNALLGADKIAADVEFEIEEGSLLALRFEDGLVKMDVYVRAAVDGDEIQDTWSIVGEFADGRYSLKSEQYRNNCEGGTLVGTVTDTGEVSWSADKIDGELVEYLNSHYWNVTIESDDD